MAELKQNIPLLTARFLTFDRSWYLSTNVLQNSMTCNGYLWGGIIRKKRGVGLFQISQKERLFNLVWQPSALGGTVHNMPPTPSFLHLPKKFSSPLQFGQEENIPEYSIERRAYWFVLKIARMFTVSMSRNRMMNRFLPVNFTPTCKR